MGTVDFIPYLTIDFPTLYRDCPSISPKRPVDHPVLAFADTGSTVPLYPTSIVTINILIDCVTDPHGYAQQRKKQTNKKGTAVAS